MVKITIELEQHELAAAKDMIELLKSLTDQLHVRTNPGAAQAAAPQASTRAGPSPLPGQQAAPTPAPAAPSAPSPTPSQVAGPGGVFWTILKNFSDASQLDSVVANLTTALSQRPETSAAVTELVDALEAIISYDPHDPRVTLDTARVERYFMLLNHKLPDPYTTELRKNVLQRVVRQLTKAREVPCDRAELWPMAVGLGCAATLDCIKVPGALAMVERCVVKPGNVVAGITMLGNLLAMCGPQVCAAPAEQAKVWKALDSCPEYQNPFFAPDKAFITKWRQAVQATGEAPVGLLYQPFGPNGPSTPSATQSTALLNMPPPAAAPPAAPGPHTTAGQFSMYGGQQGAGHTAGLDAAATANGGAAASSSNRGAPGGAPLSGRWSINQVAMIQLQLGMSGVAVAWEAASSSAVVAGSDGSLACFDAYTGVEKCRLPSPAGGLQISLLCSDPRRPGQVLVGANLPPNTIPHPNSGPWLALYDVLNTQGSVKLNPRAIMTRKNVPALNSLLLMPHDPDLIVSCETWPAAGGPVGGSGYPVCLWNAPRLADNKSPADNMSPLHTWMEGHAAPVQCSAAAAMQSSIFYTGSSDGVVRIWDTRLRSPAGTLQGSNLAPAPAHVSAVGGVPPGIVAMECQSNTLITAGSDATVCIWDIRQPTQPVLGQSPLQVANPGVPFYKLGYRDSPSPTMAAVALGTGLYLLDWTNNSCIMSPFPGYHDVNILPPSLIQHDIAWGMSTAGAMVSPSLVSVGPQQTMSVFAVRAV